MLSRFIVGGAMELEVDKAGRILIPDYLKEFAGFKADIVFIGLEGRIELWDKVAWQTYQTVAQKQADLLAEHFGKEVFEFSVPWLPTGDTALNMGVLVDPLTAAMLFFVPLTCLLIFIYSVGYHNYGKQLDPHDAVGSPPHNGV